MYIKRYLVKKTTSQNDTRKKLSLTFPEGPLEAAYYHQSICRTPHLLDQTHLVQTMPDSKECHSKVFQDATREEGALKVKNQIEVNKYVAISLIKP